MSLFARKPIDHLREDALSEGERSMKRALGAFDLITLGIGAIIGTGIFVLVGTASAQFSGPAVVLSIVVAGLACAFAGLCYAEFAAMIPLAGSAYTYAYATLGELTAWVIGWDLILEYLFGAATVAVGWSGWVTSLLYDLGIEIPARWSNAPGVELVRLPGSSSWTTVTDGLAQSLVAQGIDIGTLPHAVGTFNVVASIATLLLAILLIVGIRESARFNGIAVLVKLTVVLLFVGVGGLWVLQNLDVAQQNWTPFIPDNTGEFGSFGWSGVLRAAGVIFFAYIGFDAVSTTAQEAKNPQRDLPIGILGSLAICTVLYILVSGILTGIVPYSQLNVAEPVAVGFERAGQSALAIVAKIGVVAGLTSVMLVTMMGQPRIFFAMARDGLLPPALARVHPRFRTPHIATLLTGLACTVVAGLVPLVLLGQLVSIGTLLAFVIVCVAVWRLRITEPDRERPFRTPLVPLVPILGVVMCLAMMIGLPGDTWLRLLVWLAIGLAVYVGYGRHHSVLRMTRGPAPGPAREVARTAGRS